MTNTGSVLPWKPEMMKRTGLPATSSAAAVASRRLRLARSISKIRSVVTTSATLAGTRMRKGKENPSRVRWFITRSIQPMSGGWLYRAERCSP